MKNESQNESVKATVFFDMWTADVKWADSDEGLVMSGGWYDSTGDHHFSFQVLPPGHSELVRGGHCVRSKEFPNEFVGINWIGLRIGRLGAPKVDGWLPSRLKFKIVYETGREDELFDHDPWTLWFNEHPDSVSHELYRRLTGNPFDSSP